MSASSPLASSSVQVAPPDFAWWRQARFGLFIHWGPAALTGREISWSRERTGIETYDALYKKFDPVKFDAAAWVDLAKKAGTRYIVLTAKHCDGFMLWNTKTDPYNIMNTPFGRDVVGELAAASRAADIPFCVYYAPGDWKDPDCRHPENNPRYVERMHTQITELLSNYGKIPLVWIDYDGFPNPSDPQQTATLIRTLQPGVLLTNRLEALHPDESHGRVGPWGDYATPEQMVGSYCDKLPWETCMTIADQWSWRPNDKLKTLRQCLETLVQTVGGDGNLLFNVGPRADGEVEPTQVARLLEMGDWLAKHGEAIYGTRGGPFTPTSQIAATRTAEAIYIHVLGDPTQPIHLPPCPLVVLSAALLGGGKVLFEQSASGLSLTLPATWCDPTIPVVKLLVQGNPLELPPIYPFSTTGSLTYRRPVVASSELTPHFMHHAQAVVDDNPKSYWLPGRDETLAAELYGKSAEPVRLNPAHPLWLHEGWLEADLGEVRAVSRLVVHEHSGAPDYVLPVDSWKLEVATDSGSWEGVASGSSLGAPLDLTFHKPVSGRKFRLVLAGPGRFGISEFQLY